MTFNGSIATATAVATLAGLAGCSSKGPKVDPPTPVTVASASVATVPFAVTANGVVEPLQTVAVQPQTSGQIVEVAFHEGDEVRQGQVLFRIDPRPFQAVLAQAEAALMRDRVQADNAAHDADRYAALVTKGYVTQSQAEQQRATAASQRAVVAADDAAVEAARLNLEYATVRAPISGRTGSLLVKVGNQVRVPNPTPLVVINQLQPVLVRFTVPGRTLADLQRVVQSGQAPQVTATPLTTDSVAVPVPQTGRLEFMDNAVDTTTGAITLKASFPNTTRALWPGQFLNLTLQLYAQRNALTVPASAVQQGQDGDYVYVVDEKGQARMTPVAVARTVGELAVINTGLLPGMKVVTDGQSRLFPGARVVIRGPDGRGGPGRRQGPGERAPALGSSAPPVGPGTVKPAGGTSAAHGVVTSAVRS
jgi:multidrug efflux system membrane fusion protein